MARKIAVKYKRKLTELLGIGHSRFGKVAMRRDYREDEGGEGTGESDLRLDSHPWLANLPDGADSDLTSVTNNNAHSEEAAKERVNEASQELQMQPVLQQELAMGQRSLPEFKPGG